MSSRKWTPEIQIPQDSNYIVRITDATFAPSNSGNPMITIKSEVVAPEEVEVAGEMVNIAGARVQPMYFVTVPMNGEEVDVEKAEAAQTRVKDFYQKLRLPVDNFDPQNPDVMSLKGKTIYALLYPDTQERRKSPTAAQLKAGQKQGDVMKNPVTGKPLVNHFIKIGDVFGLAEVGAKAF